MRNGKNVLLAVALAGAGGAALFGFGASDAPAAAARPAAAPMAMPPSEPNELPPGHPPIGAGVATAEAEDALEQGATVEGTVAEVLPVERYSYLRLSGVAGQSGDVWAATPRAEIALGRKVRIKDALPMRDFTSKSLGRTFALVYFGTLDATAEAAP